MAYYCVYHCEGDYCSVEVYHVACQLEDIRELPELAWMREGRHIILREEDMFQQGMRIAPKEYVREKKVVALEDGEFIW